MATASDPIGFLFNERKEFIVIGITGPTGSGCTTAAKLFSSTWDDLKPPRPQSNMFLSNEERKYRILYNFAKPNWEYFNIIQIKNVITFFILCNSFESFAEFVGNAYSKNSEEQSKIKSILKSKIEFDFNETKTQLDSIPKLNDNSVINDENANAAYKFYFELLPIFSTKIKDTLKAFPENSYIKIYQIIGNNIRSSGNAFDNAFDPINVFSIANGANRLIKILRQKQDKVFVIIDAIRNPFEASFFRDRYAAFYLIAICCPDNERIDRLRKLNYNQSQIDAIDNVEYNNKYVDRNYFISQNIGKCIEVADIYFPNPTRGGDDFSVLKRQIVWYAALMMHPGLVTPTSVEHAMQVAYNARLNSGCISRQVGAVITNEDMAIKAVGWNNTAQRQVPCILRNVSSLLKHDDKTAYSDYENDNFKFRSHLGKVLSTQLISEKKEALKGRNVSFCFKDAKNSMDGEKNQVHTRALHAEENAFLQISKYGGGGIKDGLLFTTASPCELCAKKAFQLGIKRIYYIDPYPGIANEHIIRNGSNRPEMILFSGAIGKAFTLLFHPILPYKDEIEIVLNVKWPSKKIDNEKKIRELENENSLLKAKLAAQAAVGSPQA